MAVHDLYNRLSIVLDSAPAAHTSTVTTTGINRNSYEGTVDATVCELTVGAWTDGTHTPKIQDSPDNSTWTDVATTYIQGSFTAVSGSGQQNKVQKVGYLGLQPYVRAVVTVSGATTGAIYGVNWLLGGAHNLPTGSPNQA